MAIQNNWIRFDCLIEFETDFPHDRLTVSATLTRTSTDFRTRNPAHKFYRLSLRYCITILLSDLEVSLSVFRCHHLISSGVILNETFLKVIIRSFWNKTSCACSVVKSNFKMVIRFSKRNRNLLIKPWIEKSSAALEIASRNDYRIRV